MRKINLPLILDSAFTAVCAFLIFFTAIRYYTKNVYIALGFAICAFLLIKGGKIYAGDDLYFTVFKMQPISEDDVACAVKFKSDKNKIILCNRVSAEAAALAENFLIEIKQIDYIYKLLKDKKLLPEKYVYEGAKKIGAWKKIKARFSRKICAPLFWSGMALLALSYFTFFPVYYIISGGIMLTLSVVALALN